MTDTAHEAGEAPDGIPAEHAASEKASPARAAHDRPVAEGSGKTVQIADRVLEIARTDPERTALIHARAARRGRPRYRRYTYGELSRRAESLAVGLRSIGVHEGTLCSFMVPPGIDALVLGVALWRVGATIVGIEPHSHGLRRVAHCLDRVGPEVFFGTPEAHLGRLAFGWGRRTIRTKVVAGVPAMPGMHTLASLSREPAPAEPRRADVSPADPTVIAFTTGSTGNPKPTVLRQRNFAAMIETVMDFWGVDDARDVVDMPTFPMFWIIGLSAGGTVVVPPMDFALKGPGDADPARLLRTIHDCGVTSMFGSPALLWNLSTHAVRNGITTPTIRRIVAGGAEVPGPLFAQVKKMLGPDGEIYSDYGATEALPLTEIAGSTVVEETWPATETGAGVCVGSPLPGTEVRIVATTDGPIPTWDDAHELPTGEIGEVVGRAPHLSESYYRSPDDDRANKIADPTGRWHRLGDTGYIDDGGRLWVCGRISHRVVTDQGTAYPLRCEPVFNAHRGVARSALVGLTSGEQTVAAICIERDPATTADLSDNELRVDLEILAASHEATHLVRSVVFVERLPVDKRHNAKIDRPGLAARLSAGERR